jgi:uncharacterized protein (TIGR02597 family)
MRIPYKSLFVVGSLLTSASLFGAAVTDPVGAMKVTIPAHAGTSTTLAAVNLSFQDAPLYAGSFSAVSGAVLTDSNASWTGGDYVSQDVAGDYLYYVELTSGTYEGLILPITANSATELTVNEAVDYLSGDIGDPQNPLTYEISKFRTLADIFGADNSTYSLRSSSNLFDADVIYLIQNDGSWGQYYYQTALALFGGTGWRKFGDTGTDYSGKIINTNSFLMLRLGATPGGAIEMVVSGSVKLGKQRQPIYPGFNLIGYNFPVETTLATSGLDPAELVTGANLFASDMVYILNATTGAFDIYYYQDALPLFGGSGWRKYPDNTNDASTRKINPGDAILVFRRAGTGFDWQDEQPFNLN